MCNAHSYDMPKTPNLLRSAEVCARLNIDRSTLTRWVASGKISPAYKLEGLRGAYLFAPADVDRIASTRSQHKAAS